MSVPPFPSGQVITAPLPRTDSVSPSPRTRPPEGASAAQHEAILGDAYEEYFERRQAGEAIDVEVYCARFPGHRSSLRRLLVADEMLLLCPGALDADALLPKPQPPVWPQVGEVFGDFTLRRVLGKGAFARVYL